MSQRSLTRERERKRERGGRGNFTRNFECQIKHPASLMHCVKKSPLFSRPNLDKNWNAEWNRKLKILFVTISQISTLGWWKNQGLTKNRCICCWHFLFVVSLSLSLSCLPSPSYFCHLSTSSSQLGCPSDTIKT